jgi:hypothetical protein
MEPGQLKIVQVLTILISVLALVASGGGLLIKDLYRDIDPIKAAWFGNDLITFAIVVPGLLLSMKLSGNGSMRALLIWMGLLGYIAYNYAFYLFGAAFNSFFLCYAAIFSLSIYVLSIALSCLDTKQIRSCFSYRTPTKLIAGYLLFISLPLGIIELSYCINFILTEEIPAPPSLIFALDLSIVVPNTALAAILLLKRHPWGYILGSMMLIKAFTYGLALSISTALIANLSISGKWDRLMPFYVFVAVGGFIGSLILLKNLKEMTQ